MQRLYGFVAYFKYYGSMGCRHMPHDALLINSVQVTRRRKTH